MFAEADIRQTVLYPSPPHPRSFDAGGRRNGDVSGGRDNIADPGDVGKLIEEMRTEQTEAGKAKIIDNIQWSWFTVIVRWIS